MTGPTPVHAPVIVADDLTGAAETAAVYLGRRGGVELHLGPGALGRANRHVAAHVVDLATRTADVSTAVRALTETLATLPASTPVIKKIDSLLRGHVAAEIGALAISHPVILAAGLPAADRVVRDGVVYVGGTPLHETGLWAAESRPAPTSVAALLGSLPHRTVGRGPTSAQQIADACRDGFVAVCDVHDDADLDAVVAVAAGIPSVRLVGTSALAAAVARTVPVDGHPGRDTADSLPVLAVVGTADEIRVGQIAALEASGVPHVALHVDHLLAESADLDAVDAALGSGSAVVTVAGGLRPDTTTAVARSLAAAVAALDRRRRTHLMLTGGETARAVIDAIGVGSLRPLCEIERGSVVSTTRDRRLVATKPGSFGDADTLVRIVDHLRCRSGADISTSDSSPDSEVVP